MIGNSVLLSPPSRIRERASASISIRCALRSSAKPTPTVSSLTRRSRSHRRASGICSVSTSISRRNTTSTPRWRMASTKVRCSTRACLTQMTSSKSSSWQFDGVSRASAAQSMDQNAPKLADLGMDSVGVGHDNLLQTMMAAMLRLAMMMTVRITRSGHMKRSHRSYGMRPMASAPMTTAKVGLMRFTMPFAD